MYLGTPIADERPARSSTDAYFRCDPCALCTVLTPAAVEHSADLRGAPRTWYHEMHRVLPLVSKATAASDRRSAR